MFLKLWKYEFRASGKLLGLLSAAALSVGAVGAVALRLLLYLVENNTTEAGIAAFLAVGISAGLFFMMIALVAYAVGVHIYLLWRFYRHKFTDEGYLTFTLPVEKWQIFCSALANNLLWSLIAILVTVIAVGIALLFGTGGEQLINTQLLSELPLALEDVGVLFYGTMGGPVLSWLIALTYLPSFMVLLMTCITMGAVLAKKHKLLMAFGVYYGINLVLGVGQSILTVMGTVILWEQAELVYECIMAITLLYQLVLMVGGTWLSIWLTEKKLNLP